MLRLKIRGKLVLTYLLVGLLPFLTLAWLAMETASQSLQRQAFQQLESVRALKQSQLRDYINSIRTAMDSLQAQVAAYQRRSLLEYQAGLNDDENYFVQYQKRFGFYDVFLIRPDGHIFYTVAKEADYDTNLLNGPYKDTNLGELFRQIMTEKNYVVSDFAPYAPSNGDPAAFVGMPLLNAAGEVQLVIATQIPHDRITRVMQEREGLGETGETYLVGSDRLMRSDSYLDPQNHSLMASFANPDKGKVDTQASRAALAGEKGSAIIEDYNGNWVLSAYAPLEFGDHRWAIIAEIDVAEAFAAITSLRERVLLLGGIGVAFILLVALLMSIQLTRPLQRLAAVMLDLKERNDFSQRLGLQGHDEVAQAAAAVDSLLAQLQRVLGDTAKVADAIAQGDFSQRVNVQAEGDLARLTLAINTSADHIASSMDAVQEMMQSMANGQFGQQVRSDLPGDYQTLLNLCASVSQAVGSAISGVSEVMAAMSRGDFSLRMQGQLQGQLADLQQHLNSSLAMVESALQEVQALAERQAQGDLSQLMTGHYQGRFAELQLALNNAMEQMAELVLEVSGAVQEVDNSAAEIAQGSADLAQRTQEQAASLEETSASMEQMTSTVRQNTDSAREADKLAQNSAMVTRQSHGVMLQASEAMDNIEASSRKIAEIIGLIDSIAFQTNLLALNASVEAARAGEHGRGFGVVAGEVRTLSQRAAQAARDIKELIKESVSRVEVGTTLVQRSGDSLQQISEATERLQSIMNQIATASQEQSAGIDEVAKAVQQMDEVTQQNAALVEETSAAAESLSDRARHLNQLMRRFKLAGQNTSSSQPVRTAKVAASAPAAPLLVSAEDDQEWQEF
ncbi:methyl-accepting chemotaxis protein [Balneatrix alpica]|uniref:methyl-accepting chemotaxis protein n=1 Tax=Balneatrix alpica TaxID=75684 RepID=UPI002738BF8F|nr:methyl-accepting chemotaxis protein [Balneatrix alpica]